MKSALWTGNNLYVTSGAVILGNVTSFKQAKKFCAALGYTLRMAGTTQTSNIPKILKELAALDAKQ